MRSYPCPQCDYKAKQNTHLKEHILIRHAETKPPPMECQICFKVFYHSINIRKHVKYVHKTNFDSDLFKKAVQQKSHKESISEEKNCLVCSEVFPTIEDFKVHLKSQHKILQST